MHSLFRTGILLAGITALFLGIGYAMGGEAGMLIALAIAVATNFYAYWNSDKLVLRMYGARPLESGRVQEMIAQLAERAEIPTPKAYIIDTPQPNAFATGRNPEHGAVAVSSGLLQVLNDREVAAVIAHELAHIKNRDTLIMTITATLAGAIGMLAHFAFFFGGRGGNRNPIVGLLIMILAPIAAMLVQMAISRTREYAADATGAAIAQDPLALASALEKISRAGQRITNEQAEANPGTAHLFISNPLHTQRIDNLFSTHPNPANRIRALQEIAGEMGAPGPVTPGADDSPPRRAGPWG